MDLWLLVQHASTKLPQADALIKVYKMVIKIKKAFSFYKNEILAIENLPKLC